ncbi:MAG TPA: ATP-binding protein, partial [Bryobacteraceae bacterium]|nr:ATP-binding protein [Bryobacteraceae bacterium]
ESEERHRIVAESASDAILTVRPEGDILFANPAAARILGCGEPAGKNLREIGPDLWSTIRGGTSSEAVIDGPDGSRIILDVSVSQAVQNGLPVCIAVGRDITEKKRIEEKLRQTAKLESLGVLAGGIAHDFNNLLTGVLSGSSLLTEVLPASSWEYEIAETIARASDRAAQLTRQMLAYSGRGRFVMKPVDLSAQVRDITELIAASIPKNVHLEFDLEALLPPVEGDPGQINQIIMNLVLNGAEATGEGGGTVRVVTRLAEPDEVARQSNLAGTELASRPHVLLEVIDNGAGMDAATKSRIFDPFFTTKFAGRGLGLAAVLGIVRGHKGGLVVDSRPGAGTRFQVYFPATAIENSEKEMDSTESVPGAKGTVLVVDDEEIVRSSAARILARHGYTVLTAENGHAAIQSLAEHGNEISGVVLDLTMPDLTGAETARRLREICPGIRLLGVSGFSESEIAREFGGATDEVLPKPFTPQALIHAVSKLIRGSQTVRVRKS